jgi:hypothetical protein
MTVFYTIYQITNLVNGKIYIGKHKTSRLEDSYMGSGIDLVNDIKIFGIENFRKEILYVFDNEDEMNAKEKELVTLEFVLEDTNYNRSLGGAGGWSPKAYHNGGNSTRIKYQTDEEYRARCQQYAEKNLVRDGSYWLGKRHKDSTIEKLLGHGRQQGKKNSQFGSRWITNGTKNKKIKKTDCIPDGWRAGRVMK